MQPEAIKMQMQSTLEFFKRSTRELKEEHSGFKPTEGQYTAAAQVAHVAQTIEWFFDSAFAKDWNMDFEGLDKEVRACKSLEEAHSWLDRAVKKAVETAEAHSAEEWATPFPPNPIMGETPRFTIVGAIVDHTAHHRGALTVYQRLLGLTPAMPYME